MITLAGNIILSSGGSSSSPYSPPSGTILSSFEAPESVPSGLAYNGNNLISCDIGFDRIYIHSGVSSTILSNFSSPSGNPSGLTFCH